MGNPSLKSFPMTYGSQPRCLTRPLDGVPGFESPTVLSHGRQLYGDSVDVRAGIAVTTAPLPRLMVDVTQLGKKGCLMLWEKAGYIQEQRVSADKKLLLVDSAQEARRAMAAELRLSGEFLIEEAETAGIALEMVRTRRYDAILIDVHFRDMDGRELCRSMRRTGIMVPIVFLTAANTDADIILGLDAGADDYVTKPVRTSVLFARLRAHLRQHERSDDAVLLIGPYFFLPARKQLVELDGGRTICLTEKETAILKHLYRSKGDVVNRSSLIREVWGYSPEVDSHTAETHIYRLRQKIEPDSSNPKILLSGAGGYRLAFGGAQTIRKEAPESRPKGNHPHKRHSPPAGPAANRVAPLPRAAVGQAGNDLSTDCEMLCSTALDTLRR